MEPHLKPWVTQPLHVALRVGRQAIATYISAEKGPIDSGGRRNFNTVFLSQLIADSNC